MNKKPIPKFTTDQEAEDFIDNADLTEYDLSNFQRGMLRGRSDITSIKVLSMLQILKREWEKIKSVFTPPKVSTTNLLANLICEVRRDMERLETLHDIFLSKTTKPKIKFKLLRDGAKLPEYKSKGAAAMDCYAALEEPLYIHPGQTIKVPLGFSLEIPKGWEGELRSRSGFSSETSVILINGVGTIDADYRGEVMAFMHNVGNQVVAIFTGDRIVQLKFVPTYPLQVEVVEELSETERGTGGFGSTGMA